MKDNRGFIYKRRDFIKKIGSGPALLVFPEFVINTLFENQNNKNKHSINYSGLDGDDILNNQIGFSDITLLYDHPSNVNTYPLHAMPVGNGSLGAMFDGHPENERIVINHSRLRPVFYTEAEKKISNYLPLIRELFLDGKYGDAQNAFNKMQSENGGKRVLNNYHQVCDLIIEMDQITTVARYRRRLDMQFGVGKVSFNNKGTNYTKTYFVSAPDDLFVVSLTASESKSINCTIALGRLPFKSCTLDATAGENSLKLKGKYEEGTSFEVLIKLINQGGTVTPQINAYTGIGEEKEKQSGKLVSLSVINADELTILTNVRINKLPNAISAKENVPDSIDIKSLLTKHIGDYQEKFSRVSLKLSEKNKPDNESIHANQLLELANRNVSPKLFELLFQMGRYVLLSSSRPGGLPVNLQGLWSNGYSPTWNCRYQLDMNLQMCYWLANPVNLEECNIPLFDFLESLVPAAVKRSKDLYDCSGISLPVGVDETNVRYPSCSETQCVAGWLAQHYWEHYLFTLDKEFLAKRAYPFMLRAGEFFEDFLFEDEEGKYAILPSASPENVPKNFPGRLTMNATIDLAVVRELLANLSRASQILDCDAKKRENWNRILNKLPDWPIGKDGTLLEWADNNVEENQEHRHLSHLYPLFPGSLFDIEENPTLVSSAVKAMKKREMAFLEDACGWSYAWLVALYARAGMAEDAYRNLVTYVKGFVTADNFLSTISDISGLGLGRTKHEQLVQVEAGLGITAAMTEMFLQSHNGLIRILPALPDCWDRGSIDGLKARGNYEVSIIWKMGKICKVLIKSKSDSILKIKFYRSFLGEIKLISNSNTPVEFKVATNHVYIVKSKNNTVYEFYGNEN